MRRSLTLSFVLAAALPLGAQQVPDTAWRPAVRQPAYARAAGPVVYVDEAHNNFHTAGGRFAPFARLLEADGYRVRRFQAPFSGASLDSVRVLVVSNAVAAQNVKAWRRPVAAAFTEAEMAAVAAWVQGGGSLLLIADHMPMAGAAMELAGQFGMFYVDGFAIDPRPDWDGVTVFRRSDGSLVRHPITDGRNVGERVDSVATFTGSAFTRMVAVDSLFVLPHPTVVMMPQVAWQFSDSTPYVVGSHMLQGAVRKVGRGRVAVFGEAGMFTAQRQNGNPMGLNDPRRRQRAVHPERAALADGAARRPAGGGAGPVSLRAGIIAALERRDADYADCAEGAADGPRCIPATSKGPLPGERSCEWCGEASLFSAAPSAQSAQSASGRSNAAMMPARRLLRNRAVRGSLLG